MDAGSTDATQLVASDVQIAKVWNRPAKKVKKRLKRIAKIAKKGKKKKVNKELDEFFKWVMKKGLRPEVLAQFKTTS
jgi:hypothetical protein